MVFTISCYLILLFLGIFIKQKLLKKTSLKDKIIGIITDPKKAKEFLKEEYLEEKEGVLLLKAGSFTDYIFFSKFNEKYILDAANHFQKYKEFRQMYIKFIDEVTFTEKDKIDLLRPTITIDGQPTENPFSFEKIYPLYIAKLCQFDTKNSSGQFLMNVKCICNESNWFIASGKLEGMEDPRKHPKINSRYSWKKKIATIDLMSFITVSSVYFVDRYPIYDVKKTLPFVMKELQKQLIGKVEDYFSKKVDLNPENNKKVDLDPENNNKFIFNIFLCFIINPSIFFISFYKIIRLKILTIISICFLLVPFIVLFYFVFLYLSAKISYKEMYKEIRTTIPESFYPGKFMVDLCSQDQNEENFYKKFLLEDKKADLENVFQEITTEQEKQKLLEQEYNKLTEQGRKSALENTKKTKKSQDQQLI